MTKISKEEFVKRHLRLFDDSLGEEIRLWQIESAEDDYYHLTGNELNLVLVDREGWNKIKSLTENNPKCEECPIFLKLKESSQRTVACETARAIENCPKDKYMEELRKLV